MKNEKWIVLVLLLLGCTAAGAQDDRLSRAMGRVLDLLNATEAPADSSVSQALDSLALCGANYYGWACDYAEAVFGDRRSPRRDESRLLPVWRQQLTCDSADVARRSRAADRLRLAESNRPGTVARDFEMMLADGSSVTLHSIEAPYTLLLIGDPDCPACARQAESLSREPAVREALGSGRMKAVAVGVGASEAEWRSRLGAFPKEWTLAFDKWDYISRGDTYDLSSLPLLLVLDAQHRVVLRDARQDDIVRLLAL